MAAVAWTLERGDCGLLSPVLLLLLLPANTDEDALATVVPACPGPSGPLCVSSLPVVAKPRPLGFRLRSAGPEEAVRSRLSERNPAACNCSSISIPAGLSVLPVASSCYEGTNNDARLHFESSHQETVYLGRPLGSLVDCRCFLVQMQERDLDRHSFN